MFPNHFGTEALLLLLLLYITFVLPCFIEYVIFLIDWDYPENEWRRFFECFVNHGGEFRGLLVKLWFLTHEIGGCRHRN